MIAPASLSASVAGHARPVALSGCRRKVLQRCGARLGCGHALGSWSQKAKWSRAQMAAAPRAAAESGGEAGGEGAHELSDATQERVARLLMKAQEQEYSGEMRQALDMLRTGLTELEAEGAPDAALAGLLLRQRICHLLFTSGDYQGAVEEARTVYAAISARIGEDSGEAILFGLRLGILEAAAGNLQDGNQLIYQAGAMVAPNLQRMVEQAQQLGEQGGQEEALRELEAACQKLAVCLGESNYFGAIYTIRSLVEIGKADAVVEGWENLDGGVVAGFTNIILSLPPGTNSVKNAVREHQRLVVELGGHPELGPLMEAQADRLQKMIRQGEMLRMAQQAA